MSIVVNRVIGVTVERELESRYGVSNLHISWRYEHPSQKQKDPAGHFHLAPLVSWERDGQVYRYIPALDFRDQHRTMPRVLRQIGFQNEKEYGIDAEQLQMLIAERLSTLGCVAEQAA